MADMRVHLAGRTLQHPVLPGPGPNIATAADSAAALAGGAPAIVLQTVTPDPSRYADATRAPYGKEGAFHKQPCVNLPFDEWLGAVYVPVRDSARQAGVPCIPAIGYSAAEIAAIAPHFPGTEPVLYDTTHALRSDILPAVQALHAMGVPVIVRLSPHHGEDLADLAASLEPYVAAFTAIGAFGPTLLIDPDRPAASPGLGFLSGAPIRPIAQRFVFELASRVRKPIIAEGGICTGADVAEYLMLGATAVMCTTAALRGGPGTYGQLAAQLNQWLDGQGYAGLPEIQGAYIRKYGHGQRQVLEKEEAPQLMEGACITCTICEQVCYYDAIKAPPKTLPTISEAPCFECGLCVSACPTGALSFRPRDLVTAIAAPEV